MSRPLSKTSVLLRACAVAAILPGALASSGAAWSAEPAGQAELAGRPYARPFMAPSATTPAGGPRATAASFDAAPDPVAPSSSFADDQLSGRVVRVGVGAGASQSLSIPRGRSATIELPMDAGDVMVSDPKIADVVLSTPRRIQIMGLTYGQTDATFVDGMGRRILHVDIRVDQDTQSAADTVQNLLGTSRIKVSAATGNLILSGEASDASEADRASRLANGFVVAPYKVINLINVAGGEQVMLKVKIVEVNRSVLKQLGFDLSTVLGQVGKVQYAFAKGTTFGVAGSLLGGITGGYALDTTQQPVITRPTLVPSGIDPATGKTVYSSQNLQYVDRNDPLSVPQNTAGSPGLNSAKSQLQAFERVGLIRTLAEPNLTAVSGEAGHFLVGGEFPVPTSQDTQGRVSIEFKPYGVGLGYRPIVLSNGRISLKISTEVSELTSVGGFTLNTTSTSSSGTTSSGPSLVVPGLNVRRAETVVELPSGGAMMIAGLLQSQTKQTLDSLPGLMQLPVLGALFRSRDFQNNETELVIIVTPYIVKPTRPEDLATPADGLKIATDLETNLLGRLNSGFGKAPAATAGKTYQGPFGYVVD